MNMSTCWKTTVSALGLMVLVGAAVPRGQGASAQSLVTSLKKGGYVLVMRHASSPRDVPDTQTANADNVRMERQLDDAGRRTSAAMGKALRDLKIPVGDVLSSPTYRALETVKLAQLPSVQPHAELGDGGQSMQSASDPQAQWLRERANRLPKGTNTIIVTHMPNISRAFPEWGAVADGEVVVVGPDEKGLPRALGRIKIEEWPGMR
jgi:phosphohistidine phosphatase SixA